MMQDTKLPENQTTTETWKIDLSRMCVDLTFQRPNGRTGITVTPRTIEEFVQGLINTELSTYKQELIEWAERNVVAETIEDIQCGKVAYDSSLLGQTIPGARNQVLSDLINHIKGEDKLMEKMK